jgi:predicted nucleic acid-binding protein
MVMIDSSVWIDQLNGRRTRQTLYLSLLIENLFPLCTCGPVVTEVLQGCRQDGLYRATREVLSNLAYLDLSRDLFIRASDIYRDLRRKGVTVRKPIDCMIAAVCIEHNAELLHNDKDFSQIARHTRLKVADHC